MAVRSGCQDLAKQILDSEAPQQQVMDSENFSGPKHKLSGQDATGPYRECAPKFPDLKPQKTHRRTVHKLLPPTPAVVDHIVAAATPFLLHRTKWKTTSATSCATAGLIDEVFGSFAWLPQEKTELHQSCSCPSYFFPKQ